MNLVWKGQSISEKGTLVQLKAMFNHRNASTDIFGTFNHIEELIRFTAEAHIVYLVLKLCKMDLDGRPASETEGSDPSHSKQTRRQFLLNICKQVLEVIWLLPSQDEVNKVIEADVDPEEWCFCSNGKYCLLNAKLFNKFCMRKVAEEIR